MKRTSLTRLPAAFSIALLVALPLPAWAVGEESDSMYWQYQDPDHESATRFIADKRYARAIPLLRKVIARDGRNAHAYNLLGFTSRKLGRLPEALAFYRKALSIDPEHRGAHEYIGEAYLELSGLDKAKEHLAILDEDCWLPCKEYRDLKKAIGRYESRGGD